MSSRKEEERNEKIIRGLMKLPPNRKCLNCNSVGPQYVCTNFWTFVCVACSGIHREFTHRVKSVSMSKFTSQEVEALQKGGNQRAREIFLKDWDTLRQRLPDSSNTDKVREFIKNVYVDRRYASGKSSEKPPRDMQNVRHREEEMRRASSYHSYSQSPPYDYQYEERRYGKQVPALTRKHGSEKTLYEGRFSNFSSPSRFSDQMHEDSFAHCRSNSRASDFSISSDPFSSDARSPTFHIDTGLGSASQTSSSRDILNEHTQQKTTHGFSESNPQIDAGRVLHLQRAASLGSLGSFDSNPMSSETEQSAETIQVKQLADPSQGQSTVLNNFGGLDLFDAPSATEAVSTLASATDLFQLPEAPTPPVNMLQSFPDYSSKGLNAHQSSQTIPSDLFSDVSQQQQASALDQRSVELIPYNEGWANFDLPQNIVQTEGTENSTVETIPSINVASLGNSVPSPLQSTTPQWPAFGDINELSSSMPNPWHEGQNNYQAPYSSAEAQVFEQSWNAFEDPSREAHPGSIQQMSNEVADHVPSTSTNQLLDEFLGEGIQRVDSGNVPSHANGFSYTLPPIPCVVPPQSHATDYKSTNLFDLPCDSDSETGSMFMDLSSLQETLPSDSNSHSVFQHFPWFPQNQGDPSVPAAQQDPLGFIGAEVPSTPILTVPAAQGPGASVGGNPFD